MRRDRPLPGQSARDVLGDVVLWDSSVSSSPMRSSLPTSGFSASLTGARSQLGSLGLIWRLFVILPSHSPLGRLVKQSSVVTLND
jgi:hypothetical protein